MNFGVFLGRGHVWFIQATGFVFKRFRPERYYFGFWFVFRNFFLALVPVLLGSTLSGQIICLNLVLVLWAVSVLKLDPWRISYANYIDTGLTLGMLLVLMCVALLPKDNRFDRDSSEQSAESIGWIAVIVAAICVLSALSAICFLLSSMLASVFGTNKRYTFFLSHHKKAAACFARQMKMYLEDHYKGKFTAFLDVDELSRLDSLSITVRSDTQHLVIILTPEICSRMWCALEITTAHAAGVSIIPMLCYQRGPSPAQAGEELKSVAPGMIPIPGPDFWTEAQECEFRKSGVEPSQIIDAYKDLNTYPFVSNTSDIRSVFLESSHATTARMFIAMPVCGPVHDQNKIMHSLITIAKIYKTTLRMLPVDQKDGPERGSHHANESDMRGSHISRSCITLGGNDDASSKSPAEGGDALLDAIVVCDTEHGNTIAAARVLSNMFVKLNLMCAPISPEQNTFNQIADRDVPHIVFLTPTLHLNPLAVAHIHLCVKHGIASPQTIGGHTLVTVLPNSELMFPISEWSGAASAGKLWDADFWTVLSAATGLEDNPESRASIISDFETLHRVLAFPFAAHQGMDTIQHEFNRIHSRATNSISQPDRKSRGSGIFKNPALLTSLSRSLTNGEGKNLDESGTKSSS